MHRVVSSALVIVAVAIALAGLSGEPAVGASAPAGSDRCFLDDAPAGRLPPASVPACPVPAESEIAPEGEIELEDGCEYSWPSVGDDSGCTADRVVAVSCTDGADAPRRFLDAADLSRSCRLTL